MGRLEKLLELAAMGAVTVLACFVFIIVMAFSLPGEILKIWTGEDMP